MKKHWMKGLEWAVSRERLMDESTMSDILCFIEHQAAREVLLEKAGFSDNENVTEVLYDYVLDALGVPPDDHPDRTNGLVFSREWFYELFYSDYVLEKDENELTVEKVLATIKRECVDNLAVHYVKRS